MSYQQTMYKEIETGPFHLKFWTDGYDEDPLGTATYATIRSNVPDEPIMDSETDYYVLDHDQGRAWLYAKGVVTRHEGRHHTHHHSHFHLLTDDEEFDAETGEEAVGKYATGVVADILDRKGLEIRVADPDDFSDLGLNVRVPRTEDDFASQLLEGYGFAPDGTPVICFVAGEETPVQARWRTPLTHLINYSYGETKADATLRFGVMDADNEIIGGWSGKAGYDLVSTLDDTERYEIAVRTVPEGELPVVEHAPDYEPDVLGEIEYVIGERGYRMVEDSTWRDEKNHEGVTAKEQWEAEM